MERELTLLATALPFGSLPRSSSPSSPSPSPSPSPSTESSLLPLAPALPSLLELASLLAPALASLLAPALVSFDAPLLLSLDAPLLVGSCLQD